MTVSDTKLGDRPPRSLRVELDVFTPLQAQALLQTRCAPWVRDLNLIVGWYH